MIALISVTLNDGYKLREWREHYLEYRESIGLHIIVDNGSEPEYLNEVKRLFPDSVIIERGQNGGSTAAYNDGIRYALADPRVSYISLIGNDIRIRPQDFKELLKLINSDSRYGMVAPVLVDKKNEEVALYLGEHIDRRTMDLVLLNRHTPISSLPEKLETEGVPGGANLATRKFYETVGLQDENFFMYADEVDMGIRAERAGFRIVTTTKAKAWHLHINPPGQANRNPMAAYLMGRNHIYLARKLYGRKETFITAADRLKKAFIFYLSCLKHRKSGEEYRYANAFMRGVLAGIRGDMSNNKF